MHQNKFDLFDSFDSLDNSGNNHQTICSGADGIFVNTTSGTTTISLSPRNVLELLDENGDIWNLTITKGKLNILPKDEKKLLKHKINEALGDNE